VGHLRISFFINTQLLFLSGLIPELRTVNSFHYVKNVTRYTFFSSVPRKKIFQSAPPIAPIRLNFRAGLRLLQAQKLLKKIKKQGSVEEEEEERETKPCQNAILKCTDYGSQTAKLHHPNPQCDLVKHTHFSVSITKFNLFFIKIKHKSS
jgi:hypothetical protein